MDLNRNVINTALPSFVLALCALVYLPGISGPYIFDDFTNLLYNSYIKIHTLNFDELYNAAFSLESGPLQRPISMLSFALNHYFAGSMKDPAPFKWTNLGIHVVNGWLLFWMMRIVYGRLAQLKQIQVLRKNSSLITPLAFATAALWVIHPIQITSVLYVVQRMTELSALFTLLGLIAYLKARLHLLSGQRGKASLLLSSTVVFGSLGILSKENAVLLPIFALTMEFVLFSREWPWSLWRRLPITTKRALMLSLAALTILGAFLTVRYALPGYISRQFTLLERVMTEGRVLMFYISLILLPQINRFGHQHDDIQISMSLFHPWTTLPALASITALLLLALVVRKKQPLVSLGVLWFFTGHLLESTILPLEIAHEHRNYLPLLGIIIAMIGLIDYGCARIGHKKLWWVIPIAAMVFGGSTYLRATQWAEPNSFYRYEVLHHPDSARIQAGLAILLEAQGHYDEAIQALRRAAEIEPSETGYLLQTHLLAARRGKTLDPGEQEKTLKLLSSEPLTTTIVMTIHHMSNCVQTSCSLLRVPMEQWLKTILKREKAPGDKSFFYYALGLCLVSQDKVNEAIEAFQLAHQSDPIYLHPLFALASIYVQLGQIDNTERVLGQLRAANQGNPHPRDQSINLVASDIEKLKRGEKITMPDRK